MLLSVINVRKLLSYCLKAWREPFLSSKGKLMFIRDVNLVFWISILQYINIGMTALLTAVACILAKSELNWLEQSL